MSDRFGSEGSVQTIERVSTEPRVSDRPADLAWPCEATYYDLPVIKRSVWSNDIPAYFYSGGVAGSCMILSAAVQLAGRADLRELERRGRWIALLGAIASSGFLIHDLGRPSRFLFMLRVFRPSSPMNIGSWILAGFGGLATAAALLPGTRLADRAAVGAGVLGIPLCGYTGVLLANTVIPVWRSGRRILPLLFMASSAASGASLLEMMPGGEAEQTAVRRFAILGKAGEAALAYAYQQAAGRVREVGKPLHEGFSGALWGAGEILGAVALGLSICSPGHRRVRRAAGIAGTLAALALRFSLRYAGRRSAENPRATVGSRSRGAGSAPLRYRRGSETRSGASGGDMQEEIEVTAHDDVRGQADLAGRADAFGDVPV